MREQENNNMPDRELKQGKSNPKTPGYKLIPKHLDIDSRLRNAIEKDAQDTGREINDVIRDILRGHFEERNIL